MPAENVTNVGKMLYPASFVVNVTVFPSGSLYEGIEYVIESPTLSV